MSARDGLVLRFGFDGAEAQKGIGEMVGSVAKNMATISALAVSASQTMRTKLVAAASESSAAIAKQVVTIDNLKVASQLAGEAMKISFALHHPVLAIGMQLLGSYKYALAGVAAGALGAYEAFQLMASQTERANKIIAGADRAGVSATMFQVWQNQAAQAGLSVEEMAKAMEHASNVIRPTFSITGEQEINNLTRWVDELRNGRGFASEAYVALQNAGNDMDKLQTAAMLYIRDMQRASVELGDASLAAQAGQRATELWGEGGRKLAAAIASGKVDIEDVAGKAREYANVFSEDVLKAVRDTNEQLAIAKQTLGQEWNAALDGLVVRSNDLLGIWAKIVAKTAEFVRAGLNDPDNFIKGLGGEEGTAWAGRLSGVRPVSGQSKLAAAMQDRAARERVDMGIGDTGGVPADVPLPPTRQSLSEIAKQPPKVDRSSAAKVTDDLKTSLDNYVASLEKANSVAEAEIATLGKSNTEKARAVDLARAEEAAKKDYEDGKRTSITLTEEERQKVLGLADAEGRLADARAATQRVRTR